MFININQKSYHIMIKEKTKEDYRKILEKMCCKRSRDPIPSRDPWQAHIEVNILIKHALTEQYRIQSIYRLLDDVATVTVRILTSTLPEYIYGGETADLVKRFRDKGGNLQVVVWNTESPDSLCFEPMKSIYGDSTVCRLSKTKELETEINHFLLVGDNAYRLEAPHIPYKNNKQTETLPQIACRTNFRDKVGGKELIEMFEQMWKLSY